MQKIYVLVLVFYDYHRFQENITTSFDIETLKGIAKKRMLEKEKKLPIFEYSPLDQFGHDLDDNETAHYWIQELIID